MEQFSYTRPREKLRDKGVRSLSSVELLQILIGSGGRGVSAARIAKSIAQLLERGHGDIAYDKLLAVAGIGHAKACLVIAAIELGKRGEVDSKPDLDNSFSQLQVSIRIMLQYSTCDGNGQIIETRFAEANLVSVRTMFAEALHDGAYSLMVGVGSRSQNIDRIDDTLLTITKKIFETTDLLEIRLDRIWLVNKSARRALKRTALQ